jgi:hypothetical protein
VTQLFLVPTGALAWWVQSWISMTAYDGISWHSVVFTVNWALEQQGQIDQRLRYSYQQCPLMYQLD